MVVKVSTSEEERSDRIISPLTIVFENWARMARLKVEERLWVRWLDVGFDVEDSLLCEPASFVNLEI